MVWQAAMHEQLHCIQTLEHALCREGVVERAGVNSDSAIRTLARGSYQRM